MLSSPYYAKNLASIIESGLLQITRVSGEHPRKNLIIEAPRLMFWFKILNCKTHGGWLATPSINPGSVPEHVKLAS